MPIQSLPGSRFRSRQVPGLHSLTTRPLIAGPSRLRLVGLPVARQTGSTQPGWSVSGQRQTWRTTNGILAQLVPNPTSTALPEWVAAMRLSRPCLPVLWPSLPLRAAGQKTVGQCINNATKEAV